MPHHVHIDGINGSAADMGKHATACDAIKTVNGPLRSLDLRMLALEWQNCWVVIPTIGLIFTLVVIVSGLVT